MATAGATAGAAAQHTNSYRVKFRRKEFLGLVEIIKPRIIYHRRRMHFFAFEGFVMHTFECKDSDFKQKVLHAIDFQTKHGASDSKP